MSTLHADQDYLLPERDAAKWLSVGISTLQRWRAEGYGPAYVRISARRIGYRNSEIKRWVASRECQPTARQAEVAWPFGAATTQGGR
jgi:predicted DNA-binding transcriptional regulator AlpA